MEKAIRKKSSHRKFKTFTKIWSIIYLIMLTFFEMMMVITNYFPARYMLVGALLLGGVSFILFLLLFFNSFKFVVKLIALILSLVLFAAFALGSVYALKTDSFLDYVSRSKNDDAVEVTEKPFNVYISGMDTGGKITNEGRSDVNMIATVNPKTHTILLTSIPRDYQINLVDKDDATDKLTHTGLYGINTTISSVEDLMGIKINYYIKVNYSTLYQLVESIGGIYVVSDYEFTSYIDHYHFVKGENHMNGHEALAFARERQAFTDGDVQRTKDQQKVITAVIDKMTSSTTLLTRYNKILKAISDYLDMNFTPTEVKALVRMQLDENPKWKIEHSNITGFDSYQTTYSSGNQEVYVMEQDEASVNAAKDKIKKVMHPNEEKNSDKSSNEN